MTAIPPIPDARSQLGKATGIAGLALGALVALSVAALFLGLTGADRSRRLFVTAGHYRASGNPQDIPGNHADHMPAPRPGLSHRDGASRVNTTTHHVTAASDRMVTQPSGSPLNLHRRALPPKRERSQRACGTTPLLLRPVRAPPFLRRRGSRRRFERRTSAVECVPRPLLNASAAGSTTEADP